MMIKHAYKMASETSVVEFGNSGHRFAMVGWKSPESGRRQGPILITIDANTAIEIDEKGKFKNAFPAITKHYYPWIEE